MLPKRIEFRADKGWNDNGLLAYFEIFFTRSSLSKFRSTVVKQYGELILQEIGGSSDVRSWHNWLPWTRKPATAPKPDSVSHKTSIDLSCAPLFVYHYCLHREPLAFLQRFLILRGAMLPSVDPGGGCWMPLFNTGGYPEHASSLIFLHLFQPSSSPL